MIVVHKECDGMKHKKISAGAPETDKDDRAPVFGSWNRMYIFVVANLFFLILLFYLFTQYFS
jgi:hypothetical protein